MIRVVAFDFDGVLVESADIKTDAFRALYSDRPEHVDAAVEHHRANEGVSRYRKFRHIQETIIGEPYGEATERELDERFSGLVRDAIVVAPMVAGTLEMLDELAAEVPLYVVSGTPDAELADIAEARGIARYFKALLGSSVEKPERLREVMAAEGVEPDELLFVGDAMTDLAAAKATGVVFAARITPGDEGRFDGERVDARVTDMKELAALLRRGPFAVARA